MLVLRWTPSRTGIITNRQLNGCGAGCCAAPTPAMKQAENPMAFPNAFVINAPRRLA
jgi:hypothetical protein